MAEHFMFQLELLTLAQSQNLMQTVSKYLHFDYTQSFSSVMIMLCNDFKDVVQIFGRH